MTESLLVINADDAGVDRDVDAAIIDLGRRGAVTSASVQVTGEHAGAFIDAANAAGIGLGLHLDLTEGRPLGGPYRTLTTADGRFHSPKAAFWARALAGLIDAAEVADEVDRQWRRLSEWGARPDHVDGHNHVHVLPGVFEGLTRSVVAAAHVVVRLPVEPECPQPSCREPEAAAARLLSAGVGPWPDAWTHADRFAGHIFLDAPSWSAIEHLSSAAPGLTEWMVHPGRSRASTFRNDARRDDERRLLGSPALVDRLRFWGYRLVRFGDAK